MVVIDADLKCRASTLLSMTPRIPTLYKLVEIKKVWRVSLAALVHRLHRLDVLNEWQYRQLCIEISRKGYRAREPEGLAERETSQMLAKALEELRASGMSRADIARSMHLPATELEGLLFGLMLDDRQRRGGRDRAIPSTRPPAARTVARSTGSSSA